MSIPIDALTVALLFILVGLAFITGYFLADSRNQKRWLKENDERSLKRSEQLKSFINRKK